MFTQYKHVWFYPLLKLNPERFEPAGWVAVLRLNHPISSSLLCPAYKTQPIILNSSLWFTHAHPLTNYAEVADTLLFSRDCHRFPAKPAEYQRRLPPARWHIPTFSTKKKLTSVPIPTLHLFLPLDQKLIELLKSLSGDDWKKPTLAKLWTVKDCYRSKFRHAW